MSRFAFLRTAAGVLLAAVAFVSVFAAGIGTGIHFYPEMFVADHDDEHDSHDDHDHDDHAAEDPHDDHEHEEEEGDHIALSEQAFQNLGLRVGPAQTGDYWKSMLVPAEVVEIPGRSNLMVSSPVTGVVQSITVVPGEAIGSGATLFEIRITDEALTDAQSKLLGNLAAAEVSQTEIDRIKPFTESGGVPKKRLLELEYELRKLTAERKSLLQELRGRGLPDADIDAVLNSQSMASSLTVHGPRWEATPGESISGYSIESMNVDTGQAVTMGDDLCSLAFHAELYVQGTAFEGDLTVLNRIADRKWPITAEVTDSGSYSDHERTERLSLLRIDNHVDAERQTVRFYVGLSNTVDRVQTGDGGRRFEQWRYRPGQRMHLRLPVEQWENQITLPADAVVVEGPNAFVFAEHHHDDDHDHADHDASEMTDSALDFPVKLASVQVTAEPDEAGGHDDDHDHAHGDEDHDDEDHHHDHEAFIEFEPVPVRILHRDDRTVVIADDGQLHDDDHIALNNAYKLYLAMKMQAGGGGGHHHHH